MDASYPYIKCLKPRSIVNPYTGEHLVVPCGSCPACLMRKSSVNAMKCKLESLSHKYTMFITLTYNNVSLPRMIVKATNRYKDSESGDIVDTYEHMSLVDITSRLGTQGTILGKTNSWRTLEMLQKKVELPFRILPHLSKYDCQLFMKRLRRNLDKYFVRNYGKEAEKVRYYIVGEYGPVHFRPHYHLMLWFSSDEVYEVIREVVHQSWPFGRIDVEKSQGKCADYVAKYLNGSSPLPNVFKEYGVRPFSLHSAHLGEKVFEKAREEIYTSPYHEIVTRSIPDFSVNSDVVLWRSLKTYFFPKCKGYSQKSEQERLYSYSTYARARSWTQETRISEITDIIVDWLLRYHYHQYNEEFRHLSKPDVQLLEYFHRSARVDLESVDSHGFKQYVDALYNSIYMELRLSKHFHEFVCNGKYCNYKEMYHKIEQFWKDDDLNNLNESLRRMEEYSLSDWFEAETECRFFYYNRGFDIEEFTKSKAYKKFVHMTSVNFERSQKHKKLNDLNKIFENK